MLMKLLGVIGCCLLMWVICYLCTGTDRKNMIGYRTYPDRVQDKVKQDPSINDLVPEKISLVNIFVSNVVLFTIVFSIVGMIVKHTAGFENYLDSLIYFIVLGEVLNAFDLVIIDLVWWRSTERIRFTCAPDKSDYQDPKKHVGSFLRGIYTFIVVGILTSLIVMLLP